MNLRLIILFQILLLFAFLSSEENNIKECNLCKVNGDNIGILLPNTGEIAYTLLNTYSINERQDKVVYTFATNSKIGSQISQTRAGNKNDITINKKSKILYRFNRKKHYCNSCYKKIKMVTKKLDVALIDCKTKEIYDISCDKTFYIGDYKVEVINSSRVVTLTISLQEIVCINPNHLQNNTY